MKYLSHFLFLIFIQSGGFAQSSSQQAIINLKEGYLVVNLIVPTRKIESLKQKGDSIGAASLISETKRLNDSIIDAFNVKYTFSKVLFMYSYNMSEFRNGDGSILFDANKSIQKTVPEKFLFVEYGETPKRNINGLIVKDHNREVIKKDFFPYFISEYYGADSMEFMVNKLNKEFVKYYGYATD